MKILTVVGARPQFIKAAVVTKALRRHDGIEEVMVHTGQHFDANMSAIFFDELEIPDPRYHLGIGSGRHGEQTGRMLAAVEQVLIEERPDWMLVYGDTNSTLAGALAAAKLQVPVAHVEAGLRSYNQSMPEEINRILTDRIAQLLFTPTDQARRNLLREGTAVNRIVPTGDVMFDAALYYGRKADRVSTVLASLQVNPKGYVLATIHRAENTDSPERLQAIFDGLTMAAQTREIIWPLHPRTRRALDAAGCTGRGREPADSGLRLIEPVGYLDMQLLERSAVLIVTDSGGVQKEAFFHSVPCVTVRAETEWVELVEGGWNRLCPPTSAAAVCAAVLAGDRNPAERSQLYGAGNAADEIANALAAHSHSPGQVAP